MRVTKAAEPVVADVSRDIYDDYIQTVEMLAAHGYRRGADYRYLENWVTGRRRGLFRR